MFLKNFVTAFLKGVLDAKDRLDTEKKILEAIDRLPDKEQVKEDNIKTVKVPKPKSYSNFSYIKQQDFYGPPEEDTDTNEISFLIPAGTEYDKKDNLIKLWYISFPLNGTDKDVKEFYTAIDPLYVSER